MPQATLKLLPRVDANKTPALNEAAISSSQLIRYMPDPGSDLPGLIQKLGGWARYYANAMPAIVRALWAWMDTNTIKRLAIGGGGNPSYVGLLQDGALNDITPRTTVSNVAPNFTVSTTSTLATVTDASVTTSEFSTVYIPTHVAVGGTIIFGQYATTPFSGTVYTIPMTDVLGNPMFPPASASNAGVVAQFATTAGSNQVTVTLPAHGYGVGSTYPILIQTAIGGITLGGNTVVRSIIDADHFTIFSSTTATATTTAFINGGNVRLIYRMSFAPNPPGAGYGMMGYGRGGYGTSAVPTATSGTPIDNEDWDLDNFGEVLLILPFRTLVNSIDGVTRTGGALYYWSPTIGTVSAVAIAQAPPVNYGMFVAMPQRQIVCYGSSFNGVIDPLLIRWCHVNDFFTWIGQITNQAGYFRIPRGSLIVGALQAATQSMIWTDLSLWAMQYIGPGGGGGVYAFNEIGTGCGLIAKKAAGTIHGITYWMNPTQFFMYGGQGVAPVECPVWDVVFQNIDMANAWKIRCAVNTGFNEIAWYYPSKGGTGENDSYVKMNVLLGPSSWDYGRLGRSAWVNQSVLGPPIGADPVTRFVHQHETSNDADGQPMLSSFRTGYFILEENDLLFFLDQVRPDMRWGQYGTSLNAQVQITFYAVEYPTEDPTVYGPFTLSHAVKYVSPRLRGRLVAIEISSSDVGTFWRIGANRYRYQPDGKYL